MVILGKGMEGTFQFDWASKGEKTPRSPIGFIIQVHSPWPKVLNNLGIFFKGHLNFLDQQDVQLMLKNVVFISKLLLTTV